MTTEGEIIDRPTERSGGQSHCTGENHIRSRKKKKPNPVKNIIKSMVSQCEEIAQNPNGKEQRYKND